jgi:hypothetical protein
LFTNEDWASNAALDDAVRRCRRLTAGNEHAFALVALPVTGVAGFGAWQARVEAAAAEVELQRAVEEVLRPQPGVDGATPLRRPRLVTMFIAPSTPGCAPAVGASRGQMPAAGAAVSESGDADRAGGGPELLAAISTVVRALTKGRQEKVRAHFAAAAETAASRPAVARHVAEMFAVVGSGASRGGSALPAPGTGANPLEGVTADMLLDTYGSLAGVADAAGADDGAGVLAAAAPLRAAQAAAIVDLLWGDRHGELGGDDTGFADGSDL